MFSDLFDVRAVSDSGIRLVSPGDAAVRWTKHLSKDSKTAWGRHRTVRPGCWHAAIRLWLGRSSSSLCPAAGSGFGAWRGFVAVPEREGSPWLRRDG